MKVLIPTTIPLAIDGFDTAGYDPRAAEIPAEHHDAEALVAWHNSPENLRAAAVSLPQLRFVQTLAAGPDAALQAGFAPEVKIASGRSLHDETVAEHALALTLALVRAVPTLLASQAERRWDEAVIDAQAAAETAQWYTLAGAHVGIWGFGSIAKTLAPALSALGSRVTGIATRAGEREGYPVVGESDVAALLPTLDILISILPALPETESAVDAVVLAALPDHALFVNVGRGATVDEEALVDALERGAIRGAALDVMRTEPLPPESPLWTAPNILLTPHIAGNRPRGAAALVADNLARLARGDAPVNLVER